MIQITVMTCFEAASFPWSVSSNVAVLMSLILFSGCGRSPSPSAPSDPGKPSVPPVPPSPAVELRLVGPTTIEPGGLGTFIAMARRANGTSEDVTSDATWTKSSARYCDV